MHLDQFLGQWIDWLLEKFQQAILWFHDHNFHQDISQLKDLLDKGRDFAALWLHLISVGVAFRAMFSNHEPGFLRNVSCMAVPVARLHRFLESDMTLCHRRFARTFLFSVSAWPFFPLSCSYCSTQREKKERVTVHSPHRPHALNCCKKSSALLKGHTAGHAGDPREC